MSHQYLCWSTHLVSILPHSLVMRLVIMEYYTQMMGSLVPRPCLAFRRLQYGKFSFTHGESLGTRLDDRLLLTRFSLSFINSRVCTPMKSCDQLHVAKIRSKSPCLWSFAECRHKGRRSEDLVTCTTSGRQRVHTHGRWPFIMLHVIRFWWPETLVV